MVIRLLEIIKRKCSWKFNHESELKTDLRKHLYCIRRNINFASSWKLMSDLIEQLCISWLKIDAQQHKCCIIVKHLYLKRDRSKQVLRSQRQRVKQSCSAIIFSADSQKVISSHKLRHNSSQKADFWYGVYKIK